MKTPEEIKKGLECCHVGECECSKCPYERMSSCMHYLKQDALTYIRHIERRSRLFEACYKKVSKALCGNENKSVNAVLVAVRQLKSRLDQVERERDAAVNDLYRTFSQVPLLNIDCYFCKSKDKETCDECFWQWRGPCPENTKEDSK